MKTALIFGSTGLVGGILLRLLVKDEKYKKINWRSNLKTKSQIEMYF